MHEHVRRRGAKPRTGSKARTAPRPRHHASIAPIARRRTTVPPQERDRRGSDARTIAVPNGVTHSMMTSQSLLARSRATRRAHLRPTPGAVRPRHPRAPGRQDLAAREQRGGISDGDRRVGRNQAGAVAERRPGVGRITISPGPARLPDSMRAMRLTRFETPAAALAIAGVPLLARRARGARTRPGRGRRPAPASSHLPTSPRRVSLRVSGESWTGSHASCPSAADAPRRSRERSSEDPHGDASVGCAGWRHRPPT